ncbi:MAG: hypothetical protein GY796_25335 [Chloroflexi bacterium]|nr:hypothetical protein [Chloroflexota bacterium]
MGGCIIGALIFMGIIGILGKEAQKTYERLIAEGTDDFSAWLRAYWLITLLFIFAVCNGFYHFFIR